MGRGVVMSTGSDSTPTEPGFYYVTSNGERFPALVWKSSFGPLNVTTASWRCTVSEADGSEWERVDDLGAANLRQLDSTSAYRLGKLREALGGFDGGWSAAIDHARLTADRVVELNAAVEQIMQQAERTAEGEGLFSSAMALAKLDSENRVARLTFERDQALARVAALELEDARLNRQLDKADAESDRLMVAFRDRVQAAIADAIDAEREQCSEDAHNAGLVEGLERAFAVARDWRSEAGDSRHFESWHVQVARVLVRIGGQGVITEAVEDLDSAWCGACGDWTAARSHYHPEDGSFMSCECVGCGATQTEPGSTYGEAETAAALRWLEGRLP